MQQTPPYKNIVNVVDPDGPPELIPPAAGLCVAGYNPIVWDFAVPGTNNTDCETVSECSVNGDCASWEVCVDGICANNAVCTSLTVSPILWTPPIDISYICVGNPADYVVTIRDQDSNEVYSAPQASGQVTILDPSLYTISCLTQWTIGNGDAWLACLVQIHLMQIKLLPYWIYIPPK